jgi:hypothetical protein
MISLINMLLFASQVQTNRSLQLILSEILLLLEHPFALVQQDD